MKKIAETPLMKQYMEMKRKHPDAILLFRIGDFYETFSDDAVEASRILGITLTRRANGSASHVELAGFPHHALDTYLPKLVRAGKRVAICEQLEDPKLTKKLVKRGITELITPGVNTRPGALPPGENNFLAGIHFRQVRHSDPLTVGVAFLDVTTGEFLCTEGSPSAVDKLLGSIRPREIVRMRGTKQVFEARISYRPDAVNDLDDWIFTTDAARQRLTKHFSTASLKGFGVDDLEAAVIAAGSLIHYLDLTAHSNVSHITSLSRIRQDDFLSLDPFTRRNLEILEPLDSTGVSLFTVLNRTKTPMGQRMLRKWLAFPLLDLNKIATRQEAVEAFFRLTELRTRASEELSRIADVGRAVSRIAEGKATPREVVNLSHSLEAAMTLKELLMQAGGADGPEPTLRAMGERMPDLGPMLQNVRQTLSADAPSALEKGGVIAPGICLELDELRNLHGNTRQALNDICAREAEKTGIPSLKILYTNVFGYALEVRNTHRDKVPSDWIRKQTLVNAERYVTPELKTFEERLRGAEERILQLETDLYRRLLADLCQWIPDMQKAGNELARTDCLLSMAEAAAEGGYVRPVVDDSMTLEISEGRHPVIERMLPPGERYVANSLELDPEKVQVMMITGPNMSGKSALLRQTALIALMAQCGSFVPAESARIGLVDKIFTRVGASDNISSGESTFMVEMTEAASILNNMEQRSLVVFDELGRGTSTYDGISIAWAVVEYIHENNRCHPRTLFATHYHELNDMEASFGRIRNFNVSVKEIKGKVVFLRKLQPGGSEHSFGIHVARLAGMPPATVERATRILEGLEANAARGRGEKGEGMNAAARQKETEPGSTTLFQLDDPLLEEIRDRLLDLDIDRLTPLEALTKLHDLQSLLTGRQ